MNDPHLHNKFYHQRGLTIVELKKDAHPSRMGAARFKADGVKIGGALRTSDEGGSRFHACMIADDYVRMQPEKQEIITNKRHLAGICGSGRFP